LAELRHRAEPVGHDRRERLPDRLIGALRQVRPHRPRARRRLGEAAHEHRLRGRPVERRLAGKHLVQHRGQRVDVGPRVEPLVARGLLGAHVGRRADDEPCLGQLLLVAPSEVPRDPEVGHERVAVVGEEQVLGLDVAVDDAVAMRVLERLRRLAGDTERVLDRELPLPPEPVAERFALDERHREPEASGRLAGVEDRQDVGMLEPRGEPDLSEEALGPERVRQLGMEHLERHRAVVLEVAGEEDGGHAAAAELALERVGRAQPFLELCAQIRHVGWSPLFGMEWVTASIVGRVPAPG
jgi:hypothetical protein